MTSLPAHRPHPLATEREHVTVVVVTYGPGESLGRFLDSLELAGGHVAEVVLADNGESEDLDVDVANAGDRPGVSVLRTGGNLGYGRAANHAIAGVSTDWVIVANPDIVWAPGSLQALLTAAQNWPQAGSFGPTIRTSAGQIYPSARSLPSLGRGIGHATCGWWWPSNPWTVAYRNEQQVQTQGPVGWLSGACLLLRRTAFESVGGFDPAYFMYFEDVDLGDRLGQAGWQNVYLPQAEVTHIGAHATSRAPRRMTTEHHRSAWLYLQRRYPGTKWAPARGAIHAGLMARAALARRSPSVAAGARPNRELDVPPVQGAVPHLGPSPRNGPPAADQEGTI